MPISTLFYNLRESQLTISFSSCIGECPKLLFKTTAIVCDKILRVTRCDKCHRSFALTL